MKKTIIKRVSADSFLIASHAPGAGFSDVECGGDPIDILALFMAVCTFLMRQGFTTEMLLDSLEFAMDIIEEDS